MKGSDIGIYLKTPTRKIIEQSFYLRFKASNNEAEYEAIVVGLRLTKALDVTQLKVMNDSLTKVIGMTRLKVISDA